MKRIALHVDNEKMYLKNGKYHSVTKFVVRNDKISGLVETIEGDVIIHFKSNEYSPVQTVYIKESFEYVADFMTE